MKTDQNLQQAVCSDRISRRYTVQQIADRHHISRRKAMYILQQSGLTDHRHHQHMIIGCRVTLTLEQAEMIMDHANMTGNKDLARKIYQSIYKEA